MGLKLRIMKPRVRDSLSLQDESFGKLDSIPAPLFNAVNMVAEKYFSENYQVNLIGPLKF